MRVVGGIHDESSLDQCCPYGLAVHAHPAANRAHRDPSSSESHRLRLPVIPSPGRRLGTLRRRRCANTVARWMPYLSASALTLIPAR